MLKKITFFFLIIIITIIFFEISGPFFKKLIPDNFLPQKIIANYYANSDVTEFTLRKNFSGFHQESLSGFNTEVNTNKLRQRITNNNSNNHNKMYLFGDSFIFGHGVNDKETIPFYLQQKKLNFSFVNLGFTAGRDLTSYYSFLKNKNNLNYKIDNAIIFFWLNDFSDQKNNKCLNSNNQEVDFASDNCSNIVSSTRVLNNKLYSKELFLINIIDPLYYYLKQSYTVAIFRTYYSYFKNLYNSNKNINPSIKESLSLVDKKNIEFMLNYFNYNTKLKGIVLLDYDKNFVFYNFLETIAKKNNINLIKIYPLDLKYRVSAYDVHHNSAGNKIIANIIENKLFTK